MIKVGDMVVVPIPDLGITLSERVGKVFCTGYYINGVKWCDVYVDIKPHGGWRERFFEEDLRKAKKGDYRSEEDRNKPRRPIVFD